MNKTRLTLAATLGAPLVGGAFVGAGMAGEGSKHLSSEERFKAMDTNSDSKISADEFKTRHGTKLMESDVNSDGKVTFEELRKHARSAAKRAPRRTSIRSIPTRTARSPRPS